MQSPQDAEHASDPCLQIQTDLSAMLDGELDPASVRRVMVHSDVCPSCRSFLAGIRTQVRLHKQAAQMQAAASGSDTAALRLRDQLTVNRRKLSKILYELGRGFVLMGLSPDFSREVAREPVPVPDMLRSDHAPFLAAGVPAIMLTDTANFRNPNYHRATDTPDTIDAARFTLAVRGLSAAVESMAREGAPGLPKTKTPGPGKTGR